MWDRPTLTSSFRAHGVKPSHLSCPVTHLHLSFLQIQVALVKSSDFQVEACQTCRDKECLCAEESKTFMWNVTAVQLGMVMGNPETEGKECGSFREVGRAGSPLNPEVCP